MVAPQGAMAHQQKYVFPDEEDAKRFVKTVVLAHQGFAFFRDGARVTVIDPHSMYAREIFRLARECGGVAA